jgi:hypothetical protein
MSGCSGYVAAPITFQGRAIGILHADRPEPDGILTMDHLDRLEAFAECLAVAFESTVLEEKATQQHVAVGKLCSRVEELIGRSQEPPWWSLPGGVSGHQHDAYARGDHRAAPSLTAREREIMSHVATGATNSQIAGRRDLRRDREVASQTHCPQAQYVQQGSGGGRLRRHRNRACR